MGATSQLHEFRAAKLDVDSIDAEAGVIRGVSVIKGGVVAKGHNLLVDDVALGQFFAEGKKGKVPVKVNHKSGVSEMCGYLDNFRLEAKHVRADWTLLKSNKDYDLIMEAAEKMPECFGLSTAFQGEPETVAGQPRARCQDLVSVDVVVDPAANPSGLFSARVDSTKKANGDTMTEFEQLLAAVQANSNQLTELSTRLDGVEGNLNEFSDALSGAAASFDLDNFDPADYTDAQLVELEAAGLIEFESEAPITEFSGGNDDYVQALEAKVNALINYISAKESAEEAEIEETAFSALEAKTLTLAERLQAAETENAALRQSIAGSGQHVAFDADREVYTLTNARGVSHHEFESVVDRLAESDPNTPRATHFKALMTRNPGLYADYRKSMAARN
jgi:hypothetical protein